MNDHAADGTTMKPENQQKRGERKRKYKDESNFSGFCVICEKELLNIRTHKRGKHKDTGEIRCYDVKKFNGRRIMAPIGVNLEQELKLCSLCQGVFYNHRVKNHECDNKRIIHPKPGQKCGADSDEGKLEELTDNSGFCVICKKEVGNIGKHKKFHKKYQTGSFKRRRIIAPPEINFKLDLSKCKSCKGVFLKEEFQNHECKIFYETDEGEGKEFCLMCQLRCESVKDHLEKTHNKNNVSYEIEKIEGINTLLPKNTNKYADIEFTLSSCSPDCCLRFTYRSRVTRLCSTKEKHTNE